MPDNPDYNLDDVLHTLNPIIETYAEGSKEREALMLAQAALFYIHDSAQEVDFIKRYEWGRSMTFTVDVSHEFTTREEADHWLAHGNAKHKERVKIEGKGFMVVQLPGRLAFMVAPLPEELNDWIKEPE